MNAPLVIRPRDDEIAYRLVVQKTIEQEDVRVSVPVTALISTAGLDQLALDARIRAALGRFLAADWIFSLVRRDGQAVGYERVTLTAWTRVSHAQIFNLAERARGASEEGLSLGEPEVDYGLPAVRLNEIAHGLRGELMTQVQQQLIDYERWTGRRWRIGQIVLGTSSELSARRTAKGIYRSEDDLMMNMSYGDGDERGRGVTGAERVSLVADVTLRSIPDDVR
jgi:hypothetical protein